MGNLGIEQINSVGVRNRQKQQTKQAEAKQQSVSFFDEAWSGNMIAKVTGDNIFTDWLQNKDKVCTDGKDDGKLSFGEGIVSFAKGLIGGIPKAIINHPVATAVAVGAGAAATALTGGAILPVLSAIGIVAGVGMTGYGVYKAATADKDGDAKMALETMGMGVTTTALSVASADKALEKAAEAGVKSAQVADDANIWTKTVQLFKASPEALKLSYKNAKFNLGFHVEGAYKKYSKGYSGLQNKILVEEQTPGGVHKEYVRGDKLFLKDKSILVKEELANGTVREYRAVDGFMRNYNVLTEERFADGSYRKYEYKHDPFFGKEYNTISEERDANGWCKIFDRKGNIVKQISAEELAKLRAKGAIASPSFYSGAVGNHLRNGVTPAMYIWNGNHANPSHTPYYDAADIPDPLTREYYRALGYTIVNMH